MYMPSQPNSDDCGVYVIAVAARLLADHRMLETDRHAAIGQQFGSYRNHVPPAAICIWLRRYVDGVVIREY